MIENVGCDILSCLSHSNGCGRVNGGLNILMISFPIFIRFDLFCFLNDSPCQALQNGLIFINVNNFHLFETCDTIDWSNKRNFQKQLILECFQTMILIVRINVVFDLTLFQLIVLTSSSQTE